MNNHTYLLLLLLILCYTIKPFFKKHLSEKLLFNEQLVLNYTLCSCVVIAYTIYIVFFNGVDFSGWSSLNSFDKTISIVSAIVTVTGSLLVFKLLERTEISYMIPTVQPCVILLTVMIGTMCYGESLTNRKIIGTLIIVIGLLVLNIT